jgi:hypothetical protein
MGSVESFEYFWTLQQCTFGYASGTSQCTSWGFWEAYAFSDLFWQAHLQAGHCLQQHSGHGVTAWPSQMQHQAMSCLHSCLSWVCRYTNLMLKSAASCWFMAEEVSISLKGWRELCLHNFLQMLEDPCCLQEMVLRKNTLKSGDCVLFMCSLFV